MITITIKNSASYETENEFRKVIETIIKPEQIRKVKIFYETQNGLPSYNCKPEEYPVIMETDNNVRICLYPLSAGYGGSGPTDLLSILKLAGFRIDENDILKRQEVVNLEYVK